MKIFIFNTDDMYGAPNLVVTSVHGQAESLASVTDDEDLPRVACHVYFMH